MLLSLVLVAMQYKITWESVLNFVRQEEQNGTGHAVKMAQPVLGDL